MPDHVLRGRREQRGLRLNIGANRTKDRDADPRTETANASRSYLSDHIRPHYFQRIIAMPLQMSPSLDAVEPKHSLARKRSRSDSSNLGPMARGLRRCAGARERWSASPMASLVAPAKHPEILPKNVSVPWRCVLRRHRLIEGDDRFANAFTWAYPERARQDLGRLQVAFGACGGANGAETLKFPLGSHRPIRDGLGEQRPRPRSTGLFSSPAAASCGT